MPQIQSHNSHTALSLVSHGAIWLDTYRTQCLLLSVTVRETGLWLPKKLSMMSCEGVNIIQPEYSMQRTFASRTPANTCLRRQCKQEAEHQQPAKQQKVWQQADFDAVPVPFTAVFLRRKGSAYSKVLWASLSWSTEQVLSRHSNNFAVMVTPPGNSTCWRYGSIDLYRRKPCSSTLSLRYLAGQYWPRWFVLQRTYDRESVELGYQVLTDSDDETWNVTGPLSSHFNVHVKHRGAQ